MKEKPDYRLYSKYDIRNYLRMYNKQIIRNKPWTRSLLSINKGAFAKCISDKHYRKSKFDCKETALCCFLYGVVILSLTNI